MPSERVAIGKAVEEELGKRQGQRTDLVSEEQEQMFGELPINCKEVAGKQSAAIAAEKAGFDSEATYRRAKTVTENATPELIEAMDKGDIAISTAAKLAGHPPQPLSGLPIRWNSTSLPRSGIRSHGLRAVRQCPSAASHQRTTGHGRGVGVS